MAFQPGNISAVDVNRNYFQVVLPFSVVFGLLSAFGVFGNIFVLYVYAFRYPHCNFKYFVMVLGATDLLSCLLTIPGEIYTQYTWFMMLSVGLCKAKSHFNVATVSCSSVVLLLNSIDRHRKVCYPHRWQIRPVYALRLSVGLSIFTFLLSSSALIFCGLQTYEMDYKGLNVTVTICLIDNKYTSTIWPSVIMKALYMGPNVLIMVTTVVLYGLIARAIFKRTKQGQQLSSNYQMMMIPRRNLILPENSNTANESRFERESSRDNECVSARASSQNGQPEITSARKLAMSLDDLQRNIPVSKCTRVVRSLPRLKRRHHGSNYNGSLYRRTPGARLRRRTLIMFILTAFFVISTSVYFVLASQMSDKGIFFQDMSLWQESIVMFFFRFYYFNSLINPVVYGVLDPRFRRVIRRASQQIFRSLIVRT